MVLHSKHILIQSHSMRIVEVVVVELVVIVVVVVRSSSNLYQCGLVPNSYRVLYLVQKIPKIRAIT